MFTEGNLQQQLHSFQQKSQQQLQQQRLQLQQFPPCNVQQVSLSGQPQQQHPAGVPLQMPYHQQQPVQYLQPVVAHHEGVRPGLPHQNRAEPSAGMQSTCNWNTSQPKQVISAAKPQDTFVNNNCVAGNTKRSITLPGWLREAIQTTSHSMLSSSLTEDDKNMFGPVRETYTRALGLVECTTGQGPSIEGANNKDWVDTNRVMMLLLRTGVPAQVLAVLWEFVNCTLTGHLTREECAALLALISLVQAGERLVSADVLVHLTSPVVPVIDHPALVPFIQQFQQLKLQASEAVNSQSQSFGAMSNHMMQSLQHQNQAPNSSQVQLVEASAFPNQTSTETKQNFSVSHHAPNVGQPNETCQKVVPNYFISSETTEKGSNNDFSVADNNDDDDDFADFLSPPSLPPSIVSSQQTAVKPAVLQINSTVSSSSIAASKDNVNRCGTISNTMTQQPKLTLPGKAIAVSSVGSSSSQFASLTSSKQSACLPRVGLTPGVSPSLSFDNSQEDDFDDFQSATSDPSGISSGGTSPPNSSRDVKFSLRSSVSSITSESRMSTFDATLPSSTVQSSFSTFDSISSSRTAPVATSVLQPTSAPSNGAEDKYAALRSVDLCNETIDSNPENSEFDNDSFGDFSNAPVIPEASRTNKMDDDDEFGEFTGVFSNTAKAQQSNLSGMGNNAYANILEVNNDANIAQSLQENINTVSSSINSSIEKPVVAPDKTVMFDAFSSSDINSFFNPSSDDLTSLPGMSSLKLSEVNFTSQPKEFDSAKDIFSDFKSVLPLNSNSSFGNFDSVFPSQGNDILGSSSTTDKNSLSTVSAEKSNAAASYNHHISSLALMDGPPPLPATEGDDEEDFGDFLGSGTSVPDYTEQDCSTTVNVNNEAPLPPDALHHDINDLTTSSNSLPPLHTSLNANNDVTHEPEVPTVTTPAVTSTDAAELPSKPLSSDVTPLPTMDRYINIRVDASDDSMHSSSSGGGGAAEECWRRCLEGGLQLLSTANELLQPLLLSEDSGGVDPERVGNTQQLLDYVAGLLEIVFVCKRIESSAKKIPMTTSLQASIDSLKSLQKELTSVLQTLQDQSLSESVSSADDSVLAATVSDGHEDEEVVCCVCLSVITGLSSSSSPGDGVSSAATPRWRISQSHRLEYGGHVYHSSCANLWLNTVDRTLPHLSISSLGLL